MKRFIAIILMLCLNLMPLAYADTSSPDIMKFYNIIPQMPFELIQVTDIESFFNHINMMLELMTEDIGKFHIDDILKINFNFSTPTLEITTPIVYSPENIVKILIIEDDGLEHMLDGKITADGEIIIDSSSMIIGETIMFICSNLEGE